MFIGIKAGMASSQLQSGHRVTEAETSAANERLSKALSEVWSLARTLSGQACS